MTQDIDAQRDRIGRMTEDEILEAAARDPLALAKAYEAKAAEIEAGPAASSPGVAESVAVMREKAAELRAAASNTATR